MIRHVGVGRSRSNREALGRECLDLCSLSAGLSRIQSEAVSLFTSVALNSDPMIEYEIVYVVSAFTGMLTYWHETGRKLSEDDFTELFHTLSIRGLSAQCTNAGTAWKQEETRCQGQQQRKDGSSRKPSH